MPKSVWMSRSHLQPLAFKCRDLEVRAGGRDATCVASPIESSRVESNEMSFACAHAPVFFECESALSRAPRVTRGDIAIFGLRVASIPTLQQTNNTQCAVPDPRTSLKQKGSPAHNAQSLILATLCTRASVYGISKIFRFSATPVKALSASLL